MGPLALSHFCLATSLGTGQQATLAALHEGSSGLQPCVFGGAAIPTFVGPIEGLEDLALAGELSGFDCRNNRLAELALRQDGFEEAVAGARERYGAGRIAVVLGTSTSGILQAELAYRRRATKMAALPPDFDYQRTQNTFSVGDFVTHRLHLEGPATVISAACASTAKAFGSAARMIAAGLCDAAVVGGADTLCLTTLHGFRSLALTSAAACRPFDAARDGISIGEGAGFALLERTTNFEPDDAILLLGVGESSDAYHMSTPHPEGLGARLAMERALAAAALRPQTIDYINLHGTATRVGDAAEDRAVADLFGAKTPCSSTKGQTGHTLGACGIVEAAISALCLRAGLIPGSPHTQSVDPGFSSGYLLAGRRAPIQRVMSNSFGFGGSNCSIILGRTGS